MDKSITVVPAEQPMLHAIAAIEQACFSHPWSLAALEGELERPDACILCAQCGGEVVAYGSMRMVLGEGSIGNLACLEAFRGRGIGGRLLDALIACGRQAGLERILLEVRPSNAPAIALYHSRGFATLGRRKGFYRDPPEDALMLELILRAPGES